MTVSILRPLKGRVEVIMPYLGPPNTANRTWLKNACGIQARVLWNRDRRVWEVSRVHFTRLVDALRNEFGVIDIFEDHSESVICNVSCQNAEFDECVCRCLGEFHGIGDHKNVRQKWILVGDETLIGQTGVKRVHFQVGPDNFRPISEWETLGYRQYRYGERHPKIMGTCFICEEESWLVIDHCHTHGWIRDRICSPCNVKLGFIEKAHRSTNFGTINSLNFNTIEQLTLCPDCAEVNFLVAPPHLRHNWRPGYYDEAARFSEYWPDDDIRYRNYDVLKILSELQAESRSVA